MPKECSRNRLNIPGTDWNRVWILLALFLFLLTPLLTLVSFSFKLILPKTTTPSDALTILCLHLVA